MCKRGMSVLAYRASEFVEMQEQQLRVSRVAIVSSSHFIHSFVYHDQIHNAVLALTWVITDTTATMTSSVDVVLVFFHSNLRACVEPQFSQNISTNAWS